MIISISRGTRCIARNYTALTSRLGMQSQNLRVQGLGWVICRSFKRVTPTTHIEVIRFALYSPLDTSTESTKVSSPVQSSGCKVFG